MGGSLTKEQSYDYGPPRDSDAVRNANVRYALLEEHVLQSVVSAMGGRGTCCVLGEGCAEVEQNVLVPVNGISKFSTDIGTLSPIKITEWFLLSNNLQPSLSSAEISNLKTPRRSSGYTPSLESSFEHCGSLCDVPPLTTQFKSLNNLPDVNSAVELMSRAAVPQLLYPEDENDSLLNVGDSTDTVNVNFKYNRNEWEKSPVMSIQLLVREKDEQRWVRLEREMLGCNSSWDSPSFSSKIVERLLSRILPNTSEDTLEVPLDVILLSTENLYSYKRTLPSDVCEFESYDGINTSLEKNFSLLRTTRFDSVSIRPTAVKFYSDNTAYETHTVNAILKKCAQGVPRNVRVITAIATCRAVRLRVKYVNLGFESTSPTLHSNKLLKKKSLIFAWDITVLSPNNATTDLLDTLRKAVIKYQLEILTTTNSSLISAVEPIAEVLQEFLLNGTTSAHGEKKKNVSAEAFPLSVPYAPLRCLGCFHWNDPSVWDTVLTPSVVKEVSEIVSASIMTEFATALGRYQVGLLDDLTLLHFYKTLKFLLLCDDFETYQKEQFLEGLIIKTTEVMDAVAVGQPDCFSLEKQPHTSEKRSLLELKMAAEIWKKIAKSSYGIQELPAATRLLAKTLMYTVAIGQVMNSPVSEMSWLSTIRQDAISFIKDSDETTSNANLKKNEHIYIDLCQTLWKLAQELVKDRDPSDFLRVAITKEAAIFTWAWTFGGSAEARLQAQDNFRHLMSILMAQNNGSEVSIFSKRIAISILNEAIKNCFHKVHLISLKINTRFIDKLLENQQAKEELLRELGRNIDTPFVNQTSHGSTTVLQFILKSLTGQRVLPVCLPHVEFMNFVELAESNYEETENAIVCNNNTVGHQRLNHLVTLEDEGCNPVDVIEWLKEFCWSFTFPGLSWIKGAQMKSSEIAYTALLQTEPALTVAQTLDILHDEIYHSSSDRALKCVHIVSSVARAALLPFLLLENNAEILYQLLEQGIHDA